MKENRRLSQGLQKDKTDRALIKELKGQVEELTCELADQEDVILALQHACTVSTTSLQCGKIGTFAIVFRIVNIR